MAEHGRSQMNPAPDPPQGNRSMTKSNGRGISAVQAERRARAMEMWLTGTTLKEISDTLGVAYLTVVRDIEACRELLMERFTQDIEEKRVQLRFRLEAVWEETIDTLAKSHGLDRIKLINTALNVVKTQAQIEGLMGDKNLRDPRDVRRPMVYLINNTLPPQHGVDSDNDNPSVRVIEGVWHDTGEGEGEGEGESEDEIDTES